MFHPHTHTPAKDSLKSPNPPGPENGTLFGNRVVADVVSEDEVMMSRVGPTSDASRVLVRKWPREDREPRKNATWSRSRD